MAQSFHITPASPYATLDSAGSGKVAFTITNTAAKPIRAWPDLKPLGSAKREWFQIEGQTERSFAANEAHVFTVVITVPPGTSAGRYEFKLNVIPGDRSDVDGGTEGPAVQFEVAAPAPPPPPKTWLWIIVGVIVLLVVAAGVMVIVFDDKKGAGAPKDDPPPKQEPTPAAPKEEPLRMVSADDPEFQAGVTTFPLIVRGGSSIAVTLSPSNRPQRPVTVSLTFVRHSAGAGAGGVKSMIPSGTGAWVDRAVGPGEPNVINLDLSQADADMLKRSLATGRAFHTFTCFNTSRGFMRATALRGQFRAHGEFLEVIKDLRELKH